MSIWNSPQNVKVDWLYLHYSAMPYVSVAPSERDAVRRLPTVSVNSISKGNRAKSAHSNRFGTTKSVHAVLCPRKYDVEPVRFLEKARAVRRHCKSLLRFQGPIPAPLWRPALQMRFRVI